MAALWLTSIRRRRAAALGVFLIVVVASASAVAGPILVRAAEQSGLRSALRSAAPGQYDIVVSGEAGDYPAQTVVAAAALVAQPADRTLFAPPVVYARSQHPHRWVLPRSASYESFAASPDAPCVRSELVAGHCPSAPTDVLLPATSGVRPGTAIAIAGRRPGYTVAGTYRADAVPRWFPELGRGPVIVTVDSLQLIDPDPNVIVRDHLRSKAVDLDTLSTASASFGAVKAAILRQAIVLSPESGLPQLEASVSADRQVATVVGLLTVVPLVLLCWYTLVLIMQLLGVVRSREWALGRLRGLAVRAWLRSLYAEPVALLAAGAACGYAAALGIAVLTAHLCLAGGTPVEPLRLPVVVCFAGTILGAALGIALATLRAVRLPLATLLQQSADPARVTRVGAVVQGLVVAATVLSVVQLATRRQIDLGAGDLGVLLPGLLAATFSLAVIWLYARTVRRRASRPPRSIRGLVIGRRLGRNPALLNRYLIVAAATAVLVFAVSLFAIMRRNVQLRADNQVGAARVLTARPVAPGRLIAAVHKADPAGRYAMAVEQLDGPGFGGTSRVVAVDASRLARVSYWRATWAGLDAQAVRRALAPPPAVAPIVLRGTALTVTAAAIRISVAPFDVAPNGPTPHPVVRAVLLDGSHWIDVDLGRLRPGAETFSAAMPCAHGCVVRQLGFVNDSNTLFSAQLTITALSTDRQPAATFARYLRAAKDWQNNLVGAEPGFPVRASAHGTSAGLTVQLRDYAGQGTPALLPADGPPDVPAIAADATDAELLPAFHNAVDGTGLDETQLPLTIVARAATLPSAVDDGVLVDLSAIARFSDPAHVRATAEVWLSPSAPPTISAALRHAGLRITGARTTRAPTGRLLAAAPARAVTAGAASIALLVAMALVAVGAGAAIDSQRRRSSARVLRDGGIAARAVGRLSLEEIAVPAATAVVIGVVAGTGAVIVAGPRLPLFADPAGPPLSTAPPWAMLAALTGLLVLAALIASTALAMNVRRAASRSRA